MKINVSQKKKLEIVDRRKFVADHFLIGWSQQKIADECGVHQTTIFADINFLLEEWKKSNLVDLDSKIELEIRRINNLESKAWEAFFESKQVKTTTVTRQPNMKHNKTRRDPVNFEGIDASTIDSGGDAKFLNIVSDCIKQRCKLMGLDAPQKVALTDTKGNDLTYKEKSRMAISELAGAIRLLEEERERQDEESKNSEND